MAALSPDGAAIFEGGEGPSATGVKRCLPHRKEFAIIPI